MGFEETIRTSRLFILGAGFSAAAGIPMTGELLAQAMNKFQTECPGIYSRVDNYVRTCFGLDEEPNYKSLSLSEICTFLHYVELREYGGGERWSDEGSRENLALRHYLAKTIVELTPKGIDIPQIYLQFARQLSDTDIVITFNWDCLLEAALEEVGVSYSYTFEADKVKIAKLHGSVNWRLRFPKEAGLKWDSFEYTEGIMNVEVYSCRELQSIETWHHKRPLGEVQPFIVLPGFGKAFDVRHLAPLWYKPEFAFGLTHDMFIIGLSLSYDDFIIRSLFLHNLPYANEMSGVKGRRMVIINPDPLTRDNYGFLVGSAHVEFLCERFIETHVTQMEKTSKVARTAS